MRLFLAYVRRWGGSLLPSIADRMREQGMHPRILRHLLFYGPEHLERCPPLITLWNELATLCPSPADAFSRLRTPWDEPAALSAP